MIFIVFNFQFYHFIYDKKVVLLLKTFKTSKKNYKAINYKKYNLFTVF